MYCGFARKQFIDVMPYNQLLSAVWEGYICVPNMLHRSKYGVILLGKVQEIQRRRAM